MASHKEFVDFVAEQLTGAGSITCKKMFGEYGLYCDGLFFAVICGDQLFFKVTEAGKAFPIAQSEVPPYEGAKPYLLIEDLDNRELLTELTKVTCRALPPAAKKSRGKKDKKIRCGWAGDLPVYVDYHDNEWGRPVHDEIKLFEMLILEGMQAGLSWITILKKREAFREAFDGFDPNKVACYDDAKFHELMENPKIIRNRLKINAAVSNAKLFLEVQKKYGSFDKFIWAYVDNTPIVGHWKNLEDMPACTPLSDRISKDLKKMGFKFVGSTIIYSFMQAIGMVNDHLTECFVYKELTGTKKKTH